MGAPRPVVDALGDMASDPQSVSEPRVTCLLADDSAPVLSALQRLLELEGVEVIGAASSGLEALELLEAQPANVIVLDFRLPGLDGLEVARRAAEIARRKTAIIFYTSYADAQFVADALDGGARGIVLKDAAPTNLLKAISVVAAGGTFIDPQLEKG